ncbi:MAG: exonuclease SbcCD subunit D C-terminal domain-containing protein [Bacteroidia bacterium]|nr:exonuclease SbcCD subunit D C-terminal domain-containing protein [Bacteroidia bacterium]MCZ2249707.1 exonuclease SbcCD subunit D C-terminal domain-containing protein [Bacteroidia bacterium]
MKILHTSDWHLGRTLYSKKERHEEHTALLEWLLHTIKDNSINLLLIVGDIFDTVSPSSSSQKMYYDFLIKVKQVGCENVIVVGGNHDSPSFLNAPKDILAALNVTIIGNATENIKDEIIVVRDSSGNPNIIVCGVPFLRERDISRFAEGESYTDRSKRINQNIKKHYEEIAKLAEDIRTELGKEVPIIATGHLSVVGGQRNEDDGVRETYIGNIEAVGSDIFPDTFEYVALGHYHIPSKIKEHIRYCGSPIPMGFGEAKQTKCVYIIDFTKATTIETKEIPVFQKLESIVGDKSYIENRLKEIKKENTSVWVEVVYNGDKILPDFTAWVNEQIMGSKIEALKLQNRQYLSDGLSSKDTSESLEKLSVFDVFDKLLDKKNISEEQKKELQETYKEIVDQLNIEEE